MADLTITEVGITQNTEIVRGQVGQVGDPGQALYLDVAGGNKWKPADANGGTAVIAGSQGLGILLTPVEADGDYGLIAVGGNITMGSGATEGTTYVVSDTAGGIAPDSDIGSGSYKSILGVGGTAATGSFTLDLFVMGVNATGQEVP